MKKIIYFLIILCILFFLFGSEVIPDNFQPQEALSMASNSDVVIIFNSGGWGNTPIDQAEDFKPIIEGIQQTLNEWGYNTVVIPYIRTKDGFMGRMTGTKEFFNSFQFSSKDLAEKVDFLAKEFPDKKIIMAGLSNGGTFVTKTYEKISGEFQDSVYGIAVGTPFWARDFQSENLLQLDSKKEDSLVKGNVRYLFAALIKTPFKWLSSKIDGQELAFFKAFQAPGHDYLWSSPEVNSQIVTFLEDKFKK